MALEIRGAAKAYDENSDFVLGLLTIAHEYSLRQLALGARFFTILFLSPGSSLVGLQYDSLHVPDLYVIHPRLEDPFSGWPEGPPI